MSRKLKVKSVKPKSASKKVTFKSSDESVVRVTTGGTMKAAIDLIRSMNPKKIYVNFIVEISALNGRAVLPEDVEVTSLITY